MFGRYVTTETGWVAAACPLAPSPAHLHLYTDRLAVIADEGAGASDALLFTTISPSAGKQLLNTDLGDAGSLRRRPCGCPLGSAGLEHELGGVHGHDKLSWEGVTVPRTVLVAAVDDVVVAAGGAPDSHQLLEREDEQGGAGLVIVLSPDVPIGEAELVERLLDQLPAYGPAAQVAARFWRESGTVEVHRAHPVPTDAMKLRAVLDVGA